MGRLTRFGCDHRGQHVVPAKLARGYACRSAERRYRLRHGSFAAPALVEAIEDLEPAPATVVSAWPAPAGRMESGPFPLLEQAPSLDDAGDDEIDIEDDGEPLTERLRQARAPRDLSRFIAAMRAKARPTAPSVAGPLPVALSREECERCGIPGFKGCAHQLPYEPEAPLPMWRGREPRGPGVGA